MVDSSWVSAVGTLFLCLGTPQWLLYLAAGGEFMPTSLATHVVALGIGLYAAYRYGSAARNVVESTRRVSSIDLARVARSPPWKPT